MALVVELEALPLAEGRRAAAQVDDRRRGSRPRAQRTSLAWPGSVWKCIPRSVPRREREWLSCTNATSTPALAHASARNVSAKKPRVVAVDARARAAEARRAGSGGAPCGRGRRSRRKESAARPSKPALRHEASRHHAAAGPADGPPDPLRYITARFDEFSRSQKDVAQYIVDHLDEAAFQTAEELARRANTSSSTVVRFSQALGFEGFPELQQAAREEYRRAHRAPATPRRRGSAPLFSLDQTEFETALAADHVNVEETARKVSRSRHRGAPSRRSSPPSVS